MKRILSRLRRRQYKAALGARVAAEIQRSGIAPGHVAWICVDSDGAIHVSPEQVSKSVESIKDNTNAALFLLGMTEFVR